MTFAVYTDDGGYIGDVSAPTREAAADFLKSEGFTSGAYELRELYN